MPSSGNDSTSGEFETIFKLTPAGPGGPCGTSKSKTTTALLPELVTVAELKFVGVTFPIVTVIDGPVAPVGPVGPGTTAVLLASQYVPFQVQD